MTEGGSLATGSGEVAVHDDVGKWQRGGGALSVTKTIMYAYVCARDARRCPTKHA